jgi:hypothetical protein
MGVQIWCVATRVEYIFYICFVVLRASPITNVCDGCGISSQCAQCVFGLLYVWLWYTETVVILFALKSGLVIALRQLTGVSSLGFPVSLLSSLPNLLC